MKIIDKILGRKPNVATAEVPRLQVPAWLRKNAVQLPPWAKVAEIARSDVSMQIRVDTGAAIEEWITTLNLKPDEIDKYWLEVIYQCIKLDVQSAVARTDFDPRDRRQPIEIKMLRAEQWALAKFPDKHATTEDGRTVTGIERASKGREAREHYKRVRGALPM